MFAEFSQDFTLSADAARLEDPNCGDIMPSSEVVDLNSDGRSEVFVQWGNACTSGAARRAAA